MVMVCRRTDERLDRLNDLVSQIQETCYNGKRIRRRIFSLHRQKKELVEDPGEEGKTESPTD